MKSLVSVAAVCGWSCQQSTALNPTAILYYLVACPVQALYNQNFAISIFISRLWTKLKLNGGSKGGSLHVCGQMQTLGAGAAESVHGKKTILHYSINTLKHFKEISFKCYLL